MEKIAIIEDDVLLNQALTITLQKEGFTVLSALNCREGRKILEEQPDLLLLDIGLPDGNGIELCHDSTERMEIPVLFLTAKDEESDIIHGFDAGCEDYIVKPFSNDILIRRIDVALRRKRGKNLFQLGHLQVDFDKKQLFVKGEQVKVTAKEYQLLEYFVRNRGQVLTKEVLLQQLWDMEGIFVEENTLFVTIARLRKKMEENPSEPVYIKTVYGIGYIFGDVS